jgi:hypothetical protein
MVERGRWRAPSPRRRSSPSDQAAGLACCVLIARASSRSQCGVYHGQAGRCGKFTAAVVVQPAEYAQNLKVQSCVRKCSFTALLVCYNVACYCYCRL